MSRRTKRSTNTGRTNRGSRGAQQGFSTRQVAKTINPKTYFQTQTQQRAPGGVTRLQRGTTRKPSRRTPTGTVRTTANKLRTFQAAVNPLTKLSCALRKQKRRYIILATGNGGRNGTTNYRKRSKC